MTTLFLTILTMSMTGAFVIIAICIVRQLFKKAPKTISYALWAVVGFRLAFPFSIESMFSLVPRINNGIPIINNANPLQIWITVGAWVWLAGAVILAVYGVISAIFLNYKMQKSIWKEANIYEADNIKSPFVFGIFSPKIYLPIGLSERERRYVILHEQTHIKRYDHIVKFGAFFILCLHWFNPLAWLAFWLMGADMEMSCDERVINELGNDIRADYSMLLVRFAAGMRIVNSSPLAFGEGGIKERVKRVMNFKKSSRLVVTLAITLASVLSVGLAMNQTAHLASGYYASSYAIQINNVAPDYEYSRQNMQGIMVSHNDITVLSGSISVMPRAGGFIMIAGNEGAVVIFYNNDGAWIIPPGEEVHITNGKPFHLEDWLYETWGASIVDTEMNYLLEKAFLTRSIFEFNIIMHLGNPSPEKILAIFSMAAEQGDTTFFALTQNHAIPHMTAAEIDAIGMTAFERRDTAIFSIISQHMSASSINDIFNQSAVESDTAFFALTQSHAIPRMTAAEIDAIGMAAFERRDIAIFSMMLQHISIDQRELLLNRAISENKIAFIVILGGELEQNEQEFPPWGIFFGSNS